MENRRHQQRPMSRLARLQQLATKVPIQPTSNSYGHDVYTYTLQYIRFTQRLDVFGSRSAIPLGFLTCSRRSPFPNHNAAEPIGEKKPAGDKVYSGSVSSERTTCTMSLMQLGPVMFGRTAGIIQYLRRHGLLASRMDCSKM